MLTTIRSTMRSKHIAFQRAVWKKAGRYTTVQKRRVWLAGMIAAALIAWMLLRFAWALLVAVFNAVQDQDDFDREQVKPDRWGRMPGEPHYGYPEPSFEVETMQGMHDRPNA